MGSMNRIMIGRVGGKAPRFCRRLISETYIFTAHVGRGLGDVSTHCSIRDAPEVFTICEPPYR